MVANKKTKIKDKVLKGEPLRLSAIADKDFMYRDASDSQDSNDMYAIISIIDQNGKLFIESWRAWLRFLAEELRSEIGKAIDDDRYVEQFNNTFDNIQRFINIVIACRDRCYLEEEMD